MSVVKKNLCIIIHNQSDLLESFQLPFKLFGSSIKKSSILSSNPEQHVIYDDTYLLLELTIYEIVIMPQPTDIELQKKSESSEHRSYRGGKRTFSNIFKQEQKKNKKPALTA